MAPVTKKSKGEDASSSDSAVELTPITQASNSTKHNLEHPMVSDAKRIKRSEASSDISHSSTNTGKQPKAMHTTASTTESKFHYLGNLSLSDDDKDLPSMPFVKSPKSLSPETASRQTEEYVAKVKEAADQEFDKWKQQQEVQVKSKAPLANSKASNTSDNSEKLLHPITDDTPHHSSVHKSSPIEEQARSALQSTKSQSQFDFINLDSDSDDQNSNDHVSNPEANAVTTSTDDLPLTGNSITHPSLKVEKFETMTFKCQYLFAPIEDQPEKFKCLLEVTNKGKPCKLVEICKIDNRPPTDAMIRHLHRRHGLTSSDFIGKLEYVHKSPSGEIIRKFKLTGPLFTFQPQQKSKQDPSTLTAKEVNYFGRIFRITRPQPLNHSLGADKELTMYSMFHNSLLYLVASPEYLQSVLSEIKQINKKIQEQAQAAFYQDPTSKQLWIDAFQPNHTIYLHLNKTEFAHPLELLNNTFYCGITNGFKKRLKQHVQCAREKYFAPSYQAVSTQSPKLYEFISDGWKNENPFYMNDMFRFKKLKSSAAFYEHLIISCLISSPLCRNGNTGEDNVAEAALEQQNLNKDTLATYGLAQLLAYYQKLNLKECTPLDVLCLPCSTSIKEVLNRRNAVKQPTPTAYSLANHAIIPNFSLVDGSGEFKDIFCYAIYLFTSLFTIPPKLALWYLRREGSIGRLNEVDIDDHRQDYLMSISAIIINHPTNLADCIKWARQMFTLLFDTNVRLANVQRAALGLPKLHPISIADEDTLKRKQIDSFLVTTALLRVRLYNLKDENGDEPSEESMENALSIYLDNASEPEVLFADRFTKDKPYRKISHFTDLTDVCSLPSPGDIIDPRDPQFAPENLRRHLDINPFEPYLDDEMVFNFVMRILRLRNFNLYAMFAPDRHINHTSFRQTQFSIPYFRLASFFPQFL